MSTEYSNTSVGSSAQRYSTIQRYNQGVAGAMPPVVSGTVSGQYVVPCWNYQPSYNTLVKPGNCCGYPSIAGAYGADAETYVPVYGTRGCSDQVQCPGSVDPRMPMAPVVIPAGMTGVPGGMDQYIGNAAGGVNSQVQRRQRRSM